MLTIHHLNNSRSQRILWMMEELELNYEIKHYQRDLKTSLAPIALKAVHPLGKAPILEDGDRVIAESGVIIDHLARNYGDGLLLPEAGSPAMDQYQFWLHFAEGSVMPPLVMSLVMNKIRENAKPLPIKIIAKQIVQRVMSSFVNPNVQANLAFIDEHLGANEWFAGDAISGADIQMSFPLEACVMRGLAANYPNINAFVQRIHARDAYKVALEKGGEYAYA